MHVAVGVQTPYTAKTALCHYYSIMDCRANTGDMSESTASTLLTPSNANATRFHPSSILPQSINKSTQIGHSGSQVAVRTISHYTSAPTTPLSSILHTSLPASRPASTEYTQQPSSNAVVQNRIDAHQTTQHVATPIIDEAGQSRTRHRGRRLDHKSYSDLKIDGLLQIAIDVLPIDANMWAQVHQQYTNWAIQNNLMVRECDMLKKSLIVLLTRKNYQKPKVPSLSS